MAFIAASSNKQGTEFVFISFGLPALTATYELKSDKPVHMTMAD